MKKMNFLSSWEKLDATTWSGTPFGLYNALSKKVDVKIINVIKKEKINALKKVKNILNAISFNLIKTRAGEKSINKNSEINNGIPAIAFTEYCSKLLKDTYCYQDFSADFVIRKSKEDASVKKTSGLLKLTPECIIKKRRAHVLKFYQGCAGIFTMSKWLKEDLIKNTGVEENKVHFVGGGVNVDVEKIDYSNKNGKRFLFVGKDFIRKNGELVVDAFKELKKIEDDVELYILGPKTRPECIGDEKSIHYVGYVKSSEIYKYFNLCDYFVMPSEHEAYGLVFAEALCFGLPCIGKNCYAMPEFITEGKNGYLINNSDKIELRDTMLKLLKNSDEITKNTRNEKEKYIKEYSWENVADKIIEHIKNDGYAL